MFFGISSYWIISLSDIGFVAYHLCTIDWEIQWRIWNEKYGTEGFFLSTFSFIRRILQTSLEMTVGDIGELTATVTPAEATNKKVAWTTSDANVAEITEKGGVDFKSLLKPKERP